MRSAKGVRETPELAPGSSARCLRCNKGTVQKTSLASMSCATPLGETLVRFMQFQRRVRSIACIYDVDMRQALSRCGHGGRHRHCSGSHRRTGSGAIDNARTPFLLHLLELGRVKNDRLRGGAQAVDRLVGQDERGR